AFQVVEGQLQGLPSALHDRLATAPGVPDLDLRVGPAPGEVQRVLAHDTDRGDHDRERQRAVVRVDRGEVHVHLVDAADLHVTGHLHGDEDLPATVDRARRLEVSTRLVDERVEELRVGLVLDRVVGRADHAERIDLTGVDGVVPHDRVAVGDLDLRGRVLFRVILGL